MENHGRRNRRGRDRRSRQTVSPSAFIVPTSQRQWSIIDGLSSFFIMGSLLAIIFLMLDYHCTACMYKCDLTNVTKNIDDIAKNISFMKESYYDLETKVTKFAYELPKIEGQIDILEAIANKMDSGDFSRCTEHGVRNEKKQYINPEHEHEEINSDQFRKKLPKVEQE